MKLQQYFQAYDFDEIYPQIGLMYPNARHQREQFRHAYDILLGIKRKLEKADKVSAHGGPRHQRDVLRCRRFLFRGPWDVLLGKEVKREPKVDLTDVELVANMLLNVVLQGASSAFASMPTTLPSYGRGHRQRHSLSLSSIIC